MSVKTRRSRDTRAEVVGERGRGGRAAGRTRSKLHLVDVRRDEGSTNEVRKSDLDPAGREEEDQRALTERNSRTATGQEDEDALLPPFSLHLLVKRVDDVARHRRRLEEAVELEDSSVPRELQAQLLRERQLVRLAPGHVEPASVGDDGVCEA